MNKNELIVVLRNHAAPTRQHVDEIIALKNQFPFSQALHAIAARVSKDYNFDSQQSELQLAAVYATDRSVLKDIMTLEVQSDISSNVKEIISEPIVQSTNSNNITFTTPTVTNPVHETVKEVVKENTVISHDQIHRTIDEIDVADAILRDLKKLNQLKSNFEMLFVDQADAFQKSDVHLQITAEKKIETISENANTLKEVPQEHVDLVSEDPLHTEETKKSRRAKIIEIARAMSSADNQPHPLRKKRGNQSDLIEEIKTSKEEIEPENDRLKEQIEIIDQFIKTQPSITNVKDRNPLPPADLNVIKSGEFGENIVSETLVEILVKQGKKERAIEVLKKLIWKYPQKKAYFASQIEDLKK